MAFAFPQVPQCVDALVLHQNHSKSLIFPMTFALSANPIVLMIGFPMKIAWFPYDFCTFRVFQCTDYLIPYQNRLVSL